MLTPPAQIRIIRDTHAHEKPNKKHKPHRGYGFVVFEREKDMRGNAATLILTLSFCLLSGPRTTPPPRTLMALKLASPKTLPRIAFPFLCSLPFSRPCLKGDISLVRRY